MLTIDGSIGGGQILRSALTSSLATGTPFRISGIRAARSKPGLQRQHLASVHAALAVSESRVEGAIRGSSELTFWPGRVRPGAVDVSIGSAGSVALVFQTILLPLLLSNGSSNVAISGGTHIPLAPSAEFVSDTFLGALREFGALVHSELVRPGFYPKGDGEMRFSIQPSILTKADLRLVAREAVSISVRAYLPANQSELDAEAVLSKCGKAGYGVHGLEIVPAPTDGLASPVFVLQVAGSSFSQTFCDVPYGEGVSDGLDKALGALDRCVRSKVSVDPFLADQLILPIAVAGGGGFSTFEVTDHLRTNLAVVSMFFGLDFAVVEYEPGLYHVQVAESGQGTFDAGL